MRTQVNEVTQSFLALQVFVSHRGGKLWQSCITEPIKCDSQDTPLTKVFRNVLGSSTSQLCIPMNAHIIIQWSTFCCLCSNRNHICSETNMRSCVCLRKRECATSQYHQLFSGQGDKCFALSIFAPDAAFWFIKVLPQCATNQRQMNEPRCRYLLSLVMTRL